MRKKERRKEVIVPSVESDKEGCVKNQESRKGQNGENYSNVKTVSLYEHVIYVMIQARRCYIMANEDKKDFNAMLNDSKDMPKFQTITDEKSIEKYGGDRMYFAPPIDYDKVMRLVPVGKLLTVGAIREYFAKQNGADFTEPITAGIFVSIAAWASYQRENDKTPYWRTLKANGELNPKYPGGVEAQKEMLEQEGHVIIQKGRTNIKYYVKDYEQAL